MKLPDALMLATFALFSESEGSPLGYAAVYDPPGASRGLDSGDLARDSRIARAGAAMRLLRRHEARSGSRGTSDVYNSLRNPVGPREDRGG